MEYDKEHGKQAAQTAAYAVTEVLDSADMTPAEPMSKMLESSVSGHNSFSGGTDFSGAVPSPSENLSHQFQQAKIMLGSHVRPLHQQMKEKGYNGSLLASVFLDIGAWFMSLHHPTDKQNVVRCFDQLLDEKYKMHKEAGRIDPDEGDEQKAES